MSILIKGMEMPSCCAACKVLCDAKSETEIIRPFGERLSNCPLIEIPDKHGRLIDADALAKDYDSFPVRIDPWVWNELSHAPTIIPAEPCNDLAKPNIDADYPPGTPLEQVWTELFGEEGE